MSVLILDRVKAIVAVAYGVGVADITAQTHFGYDLNDSLQIVEVVMACEEAFNVDLFDEDVEKCSTVGELANVIGAKIR